MRVALVSLLCVVSWAAAALSQDGASDGTAQVSGTLTFTCTPDEKSKKAGATEFEDTLELGSDRMKSAVLAKEGFADAPSHPKTVNGIPTFNAVFKKAGVTATYFIRAKPGKAGGGGKGADAGSGRGNDSGDVSGSFTRVEGGKTLRYTIGASTRRQEREGAAGEAPAKSNDVMLDAGVLRVNGGFVRLMAVQVAMADAGVNADKAKLAAILKSAGTKQNELRVALASHKMKADSYADQADGVLRQAHEQVEQLLGADNAKKVRAAYDAPFAAGYVALNQMRAAAAESRATAGAVKRADQAVYQSLLELTKLARTKDQLTADAVKQISERTKNEIETALDEGAGGEGTQRARFEKMLAGLSAYKPK